MSINSTPIFANIVRYNISPDEVVFNFGTMFAEDGHPSPSSEDYHTLIIMNASALDSMIPVLQNLVKLRDDARQKRVEAEAQGETQRFGITTE